MLIPIDLLEHTIRNARGAMVEPDRDRFVIPVSKRMKTFDGTVDPSKSVPMEPRLELVRVEPEEDGAAEWALEIVTA